MFLIASINCFCSHRAAYDDALTIFGLHSELKHAKQPFLVRVIVVLAYVLAFLFFNWVLSRCR